MRMEWLKLGLGLYNPGLVQEQIRLTVGIRIRIRVGLWLRAKTRSLYYD